jgi:hypothetical protein
VKKLAEEITSLLVLSSEAVTPAALRVESLLMASITFDPVAPAERETLVVVN